MSIPNEMVPPRGVCASLACTKVAAAVLCTLSNGCGGILTRTHTPYTKQIRIAIQTKTFHVPKLIYFAHYFCDCFGDCEQVLRGKITKKNL